MKHGCVAHRSVPARGGRVRRRRKIVGTGNSLVILVFSVVLEVTGVLDVLLKGTFHTQELARTLTLAQPPGGVFPCDWDTLRTEGRGRAFPSMGSPVRSLVPVCQTPKTALKSASREFARPTPPGRRRRLPIRVKRGRMACWRIGLLTRIEFRVSSLPNLSGGTGGERRHLSGAFRPDQTFCGV
jgi:hypothetical protein